MILLDTNVLSELTKPLDNPTVQTWFDSQVADTLFLSAISLSELLTGVAIMPQGRRRQSLFLMLEEIVVRIFKGRVLPFDEAAARAYATIIVRARKRGRAIAPLDGKIAAIAAVHGFVVATRDVGPFLAAGVGVVNPWEA